VLYCGNIKSAAEERKTGWLAVKLTVNTLAAKK
jgi:hypothetical protein